MRDFDLPSRARLFSGEDSACLKATQVDPHSYGHLLGEYDGTGALIEETVWLGDIPIATLRPSGATVGFSQKTPTHVSHSGADCGTCSARPATVSFDEKCAQRRHRRSTRLTRGNGRRPTDLRRGQRKTQDACYGLNDPERPRDDRSSPERSSLSAQELRDARTGGTHDRAFTDLKHPPLEPVRRRPPRPPVAIPADRRCVSGCFASVNRRCGDFDSRRAFPRPHT